MDGEEGVMAWVMWRRSQRNSKTCVSAMGYYVLYGPGGWIWWVGVVVNKKSDEARFESTQSGYRFGVDIHGQ